MKVAVKVIGTQGVLNFDFGRSKITYNTKDNVKWVEEDIAVDVDSIYLSEYENVLAAFKGKDAHLCQVNKVTKLWK